MKKILVLISLLPGLPLLLQAQEFDWLDNNIAVANQHIAPKYQALAMAADQLLDNVNTMCLGTPVNINEQVKDAYNQLFVTWAQVQHIKFGPVSFLERYERFHYWPDKHNVGSRQLQRLLASLEDGTLATSDLKISDKSVSLQGLSALQRLFFSQDPSLDETKCFLSVEIAKNLKDIADQVDQSWRLKPVEFAKEFELANRGQGTYGSNLEISTMIANALATQLLIVAEYKLGKALPKKEGGRVYQRELEAWQSELSLDIISSTLKSLEELYLIAFSNRTSQVDSDLDEDILAQFEKLYDLIDGFDQALIKTIVNPDKVPLIIALQSQVMQLESLVRSKMFSKLEFATQFNSLDGD
ncbi:MAG: imelysin family protein [Acidiferrobacterales bacterium]|nr:imelysin family protein [Acidiferrobacterales bacterium]